MYKRQGMYYSETDKGIEATDMYRVNNDSDCYLNGALPSFTTEESEIVNSNLADMGKGDHAVVEEGKRTAYYSSSVTAISDRPYRRA